MFVDNVYLGAVIAFVVAVVSLVVGLWAGSSRTTKLGMPYSGWFLLSLISLVFLGFCIAFMPDAGLPPGP